MAVVSCTGCSISRPGVRASAGIPYKRSLGLMPLILYTTDWVLILAIRCAKHRIRR
jgi:hypothetical protein